MSELEATSAHDFLEDRAARPAPIARGVVGDLVQFAEFILIIVAAIGAAVVGHAGSGGGALDIQPFAAAGIVGATAFTALVGREGHYEFNTLISTRGRLSPIFSRWMLTVFGLIAFAFALKLTDSFPRGWLAAWTGAALVSIIAARLTAGVVVRRLAREHGALARRIAVIGDTQAAAKFAEITERSPEAISIVGVFRVAAGCAASIERDFDLTGDLARLAALARRGELDDIVIALPGAGRDEMAALVNKLSILPVSVSICASELWLDHRGGEVVRIGGAPALSLYRRPLEGWGGIVKSIEDRALGGLLLLAASPVMLLIAIGIKLQGRGPVFFRQKRHGFNHAVFNIYKFRTMTVAEDGAVVRQATKNDQRITPLGKILRRYSLDELPQLINVVIGDMSLVGPRPHALAHNHQYARAVENYSGRHKVKPGITGWAQVNGCRGETSEDELMAERVRYDLEYIDNWSLWFDFKILLLTGMAVLFPKNAY